VPSLQLDLAHPWDLPPHAARELQQRLAEKIVLRPLPAEGPKAPKLAAGVDVGYSRDGEHAWACAVVLDRQMRVVDRTIVPGTPDREYETGMLAFREGRLTLAALRALSVEPDLVFCDGHGVVHERGLGLASHMGVLLGLPVVGAPKTPFHAVEELPEPGRGHTIVYTKEWGAQGAALRLRSHSKPVYVSPGHLVDLDSSIALCLAWSTGSHRVPEPLQRADTLSKIARNEARPT
jgi:deoxyribonuclease V